jgi:hypothetical protein
MWTARNKRFNAKKRTVYDIYATTPSGNELHIGTVELNSGAAHGLRSIVGDMGAAAKKRALEAIRKLEAQVTP